MITLTKNDFDDLEECECGKPFFKYSNSSKNIFYAKCANFDKEYDFKTKRWIPCKKKPCDNNFVYHGDRPVFIQKDKENNKGPLYQPPHRYNFETNKWELSNNVLTEIKNEINTFNNVEQRLRLLFKFLLVSRLSSTLQEIDLIVKNKLDREPRKTFYYPTTDLFMRVSHLESYEDYYERIFSKKIVLNTPILEKPKENKPILLVDHPIVHNLLGRVKTTKIVKKPVKKIVKKNNFIEVIEQESESNSESERSDDSESEIDSNKDDSDYEDTETEIINDFDENEYNEEPEDDNYGDYSD